MTQHHRFTDIDPQIEAKVENLLNQMTLTEKVWQMTQLGPNAMKSKPGLIEEEVRKGAGSILNYYNPAGMNRLQKIALEESRLKIPLILGNDVIHGYRTIFPIPLAWSCSWNPDLVQEAARIAAEEARANGTHWTFAPMVDIARDARWGRIAEGSGEDVYLGIEMAKAQVRGFQSPLSNGRSLVSCPKHYVGYGATEDGRDYNGIDISERTLRDVYLPPFKAAFDEGAGTTMSAFNDISGVPASANAFTLRQILREEWGWTGMVVSDWDSIGELIHHGFAADLKEASKRAVLAGVDMDMMSHAYPSYLVELVADGSVPEAILDEAVRRILRLKFMLGLFEEPYSDESEWESAILKPDYLQTALALATESMVLLKNEGDLLPLSPDLKKIALIGPLADDHHEILGCWYRIGQDKDTESVLDGLQQVLPDADIVHVVGCDLEGKIEPDVATAVSAANASDITIMVLGEGEFMSGEAHSRAYLDLPGRQQELLAAVVATGKPVVVVLMSGRPLTIPWLDENVPAILQAWHGGLRTGRAVADLLFGFANPSGRLTASWPRTVGQVPIYYSQKSTGRPLSAGGVVQFDKNHYTRYIDEEQTPLYPFGYGLSYSKFVYSDLVVETPEVAVAGELVVTAVVTNTGSIPGTETVQLYVRDLVGEVTRPVKELKGFQRI
ncbi:MAG: glycoside hydrolase family 3 C-terminal domain-containing protein, partial [Anaerolineae bacterium]|nr:glycoside hydrolase family 3 C-terminal domain-containing protein [Anaerolineae bacterium]